MRVKSSSVRGVRQSKVPREELVVNGPDPEVEGVGTMAYAAGR